MNIGIIGDGQLGRMLALSGYPLGFNFAFLGKNNSSSNNLGQIFNNISQLEDFADIITYESESTDVNLIKSIKKPVFPNADILFTSQHRGREKSLFNKLDIPCASYKIINNKNELEAAVNHIGIPCILKTTTQGYDGKGQYLIKNKKDINKAWQQLANNELSYELIVEDFIDFEYEVSLIAVSNNIDIKYYPMTINKHKNGILNLSKTATINNKLKNKAQQYINKILKTFNYKGVLTIEFFVSNNSLIANEIAPRVHNSGHWSINGCRTSQFENHIRAISNMPLGDTSLIYKFCAMINMISNDKYANNALNSDNAHLHLYNKEFYSNRKIGHINICDNNNNKLDKTINHILC